MTPLQRQLVKKVFGNALELDAGARTAYVRDACGEDSVVHREVQRLLAADRSAGSGFLAVATSQHQADGEEKAPGAAMPGLRLGAYQIVDLIGVGGMGEVYRAFRADDEYRKEVAIKLVRDGLDSRAVFTRFRNERQILANLDHPNIARLFDAGTSEEGAPYFVMELIEGQGLLEYCDDRNLQVNDRIKLFLEICSAVQFAHQRLIVHRDIKPSNILVTVDGTPKLLDFGVSKVLDAEGQSDATQTMFRALTPAYASPEQIKGEPITTASDVYSLGVLLYELLTGRSPYPAASRTPHEISRSVCETEPERPSSAVMRCAPAKTGEDSAGESGVIRSRRTVKQLKGDLDTIVLKALRKEPGRRYISVEEFARDIRRYLDHLPVIARKDTLGYRTAKFVRRHRAVLVAAAAFVVASIAGVAMIIREARLAERRFNDVRKLANSVIFELPQPIHALPGAVAVEKTLYANGLKYLDGLATEARGDVSLQRELAAGYKQLADSLGSPYASNLGDAEGARAAYLKALELREAIAKRFPDSLPDQLELAKLYRTLGYQRYLSGEVVAGHDYIHQALGISKPIAEAHDDNPQALGEWSVDLLTAGNIDGESWDSGFLGTPAIALSYHLQSLEIAQRLAARQPANDIWERQALFMLTVIGWDFISDGRPAGVMDSAQKALRILNGMRPRDPAGLAWVAGERAQIHSLLGQAYLLSGRVKEAVSEWKSAFPGYNGLYDPQDFKSRETLAGGYAGWGHAEVNAGDTRAGLGHIRQGLELLIPGTSPDGDKYSSIEIAQCFLYEGEALERQGNFAEALALYEKALDRFRSPLLSKFAHHGTLMAGNLVAIARVLSQLGSSEEARRDYEEAVRMAEPAGTSQQPNSYARYALYDAYAGLGNLRLRSARNGNYAGSSLREACGWFRKSLDIWQSFPAPLATTSNGLMMTDYESVAAHGMICNW